MSTKPPDPEPGSTPDLETGGGVQPGHTPPESAQTSGLSHPQPMRSRTPAVVSIVIGVVVALIVAALVIALATGWLGL